ncbi:MAG TPA: hypothetical protein DDX39_07050 [Bacteroidales bacterium]|nr:MAG: hypothetical protein A2W98_12225 [Bacteroidetes bacterium GWF2_33_38]OFY73892.1 MAG: hypothetical protein A2265_11550 [Bacteroidetes bacterium RIFOXYA12_FULL_33_9]HBF88386.1 hypothetical protein [Bacteroidales bacterium]
MKVDISGSEILVIILVFLILFGSKRIPEVARGLGKGINEFKKATNEIKKEIISETESENPLKDIKNTVNNSVKDIKIDNPFNDKSN